MVVSRKPNYLDVYKKFYIDRNYEQIDLFELLKNRFEIENVIYPGSYVQISPAFIFQQVAFIDSDKVANSFFNDDKLLPYINKRKTYSSKPKINFYAQDYTITIPSLENKFDLLISQYAGFISDSCKAYLKVKGYLLVNNSHADAGLAAIDKDYQLVATIHKSSDQYEMSFSELDDYFVPKKQIVMSKEYLYKEGKGVIYKKAAPLYLFQRVS